MVRSDSEERIERKLHPQSGNILRPADVPFNADNIISNGSFCGNAHRLVSDWFFRKTLGRDVSINWWVEHTSGVL